MKLKKQVAISLVTHVIAIKSAYVGVKAFINTCQPSSMNDLNALLDCIRKSTNALVDAYQDDRGYWHFITTA